MPNAIEPTDAEINIAKFNKSAIASPSLAVLGSGTRRVPALRPPKNPPGLAQESLSAIVAENLSK
jgi:hypothetical protein